VNFLVASLVAFITYLIFTIGTGTILGLWSSQEIVIGLIVAVLTGGLSRKIFFYHDGPAVMRMANPVRWLAWTVYFLGPFMVGLVKANIDVATRVITGKINPGIVKVNPGYKSDFAVMMLANSITLTPGTLTVDVNEENNDMYIHWIDVKNANPDPKEVYGSFGDWVRRIAE
jgi:multicomponent Na+:H+ antiporter subunit E